MKETHTRRQITRCVFLNESEAPSSKIVLAVAGVRTAAPGSKGTVDYDGGGKHTVYDLDNKMIKTVLDDTGKRANFANGADAGLNQTATLSAPPRHSGSGLAMTNPVGSRRSDHWETSYLL